MSFDIFVLSMKLWNTWKDNLEVLGIIFGAFHVDVKQEDLEHMSIYICVDWEYMQHMSYETFVLSIISGTSDPWPLYP